MQVPGKLMNQTSKNDKKPDLGPNFDPSGPKKFFEGFTSTRY